MHILLLHYSAPPVVGGVESVIGHHARLLADAGHRVRIVAGRGLQTDERIEFVQVPLADSRHPDILLVKKELDRGKVPEEFYDLVDKLAAQLRTVVGEAECVIAHNVCSLNKNLPLTAALKKISEEPAGPHLILWHHDLAWTTPRYRDELHEGYPWDLLCTPWQDAEQVTISAYRRDELVDLMKLPEAAIAVVPNGVDIERFLKLEGRSVELVGELDLLEADPLLLLPVRITPRKNIELALRVMAEVRTSAPEAKLVVTGPPGPHNPANAEYFEQLLSLRATLGLERAIHFLAELSAEFLPDNVVGDFYRLADAIILPSREEGFGIPVLEAGLAGVPVFCADIPPLRDLGGAWVDYFSLEAHPADIASLILKRLSANPTFGFRKFVRSHYAWQQVYRAQIQPLLEKVRTK